MGKAYAGNKARQNRRINERKGRRGDYDNLADEKMRRESNAAKVFQKANKEIGNIRKREQRIMYNKSLSGEEKEKELLKLHRRIGKKQEETFKRMDKYMNRLEK